MFFLRLWANSLQLWQSLPNTFPSLYNARKSLGVEVSFTKYVSCPKCFKLYLYEKAWQRTGSQINSNCCNCIHFPNHPQCSKRKKCNAILLKRVELSSGQQLLYPYKVFCYKSLQSILQQLLLRPYMFRDCNHWRCRKTCENTLQDIYDGRVWKAFQYENGSPFLAAPFTYGLALNIDWFQPYSHTVASVGVIYLTILNLPRHMRYKRENILLVGIIPGPSEPSHDINPFLEPLVSELKDFWHGVPLKVHTGTSTTEHTVRCALLCIACDLPAGRKVCGFLSHSATKGCSKCLKLFSGRVGSMCYSGFDRSLWPPRTNEIHRSNVEEVLKCQTKTARAKLESELGCRYSILQQC